MSTIPYVRDPRLPEFAPVPAPNRAERRSGQRDRYPHHAINLSREDGPEKWRAVRRLTRRHLVTLGCAMIRRGKVGRYRWLDPETITIVTKYSPGWLPTVASVAAIGAAGIDGAAEEIDTSTPITIHARLPRIRGRDVAAIPRVRPTRGPDGTANRPFRPRE